MQSAVLHLALIAIALPSATPAQQFSPMLTAGPPPSTRPIPESLLRALARSPPKHR